MQYFFPKEVCPMTWPPRVTPLMDPFLCHQPVRCLFLYRGSNNHCALYVLSIPKEVYQFRFDLEDTYEDDNESVSRL